MPPGPTKAWPRACECLSSFSGCLISFYGPLSAEGPFHLGAARTHRLYEARSACWSDQVPGKILMAVWDILQTVAIMPPEQI